MAGVLGWYLCLGADSVLAFFMLGTQVTSLAPGGIGVLDGPDGADGPQGPDGADGPHGPDIPGADCPPSHILLPYRALLGM